MIHKIDKSMFRGSGPISILYPGLALSKNDTGIASIGRIDHAEFHGNTIIKMHPHINDEILTYCRSGKAEHKDSEGLEKTIGEKTLMLMKAGASFYHEEAVLGDEETFEGLQIFIRPSTKDLKPEVVFLELDSLHSENTWRLIASPQPKTKFQFSSETWLYDTKLTEGKSISLPTLEKENLTALLYVFHGNASINQSIILGKKDSVLVKNEAIEISANTDTELVLFVTNEQGDIFKDGMYSGNKL